MTYNDGDEGIWFVIYATAFFAAAVLTGL